MPSARNSSFANGNTPSSAKQNQVDASGVAPSHGAGSFVDSMEVLAPNEVSSDGGHAGNKVQENQGAIDDERPWHDRWADTIAGKLAD